MHNSAKIALLLLSAALATVSVDAQSSASSSRHINTGMTAAPAAFNLATAGKPGCANSPTGGNCPESAPCCSHAGYCGSDALFCGETCQPGGSFDPKDSCWPLPMSVNLHDEFKDPSRLVEARDYNGFPDSADWVVDYSLAKKPHAEITADQKLVLKLNRHEPHPDTGGGIGATVHSSRWLHYGTIEARLKTAATGPGTVSSFILISSISGDEIDYEIVGKDPLDVQTNYYYRVQPGRPVDYTRSDSLYQETDTSADYHDYKIEWTPTEMKWSIDGKFDKEHSRNVTKAEAGGSFPDTPMRVAFGLWDGGSFPNEGTSDWAGKNTSYAPNNEREYIMSVEWVKITPLNPEPAGEPWPGSKYLKRMEESDGGKGGSGGSGGPRVGRGKSGATALTSASSLATAVFTASLAAFASFVFA
ncbi:hypothetical protein DFQ27_001977 [Actinomortierella ambigua]|uniref:Uncharacterized protein n=1 Tax=Actinomortierella ambigua TaxID=1343610 RepID=A0A9P6QAK7_9FUNG|nr:hypothetical protein DFQ27_001977 [Actinomortierella ambigua]